MKDQAVSRATLITGCSTGIGRATAIRLRAAGFPVCATARRPDSIADLAEHGCRLLQLDVTDEVSMSKAVSAIEAEHGSVGVLVSNAGYGLAGLRECVSLAPRSRLGRRHATPVSCAGSFGLR